MSKRKINTDVYLKIADYAKYANVSRPTVHAWIVSGKIPPDKIRTVLGITVIKKELYP